VVALRKLDIPTICAKKKQQNTTLAVLHGIRSDGALESAQSVNDLVLYFERVCDILSLLLDESMEGAAMAIAEYIRRQNDDRQKVTLIRARINLALAAFLNSIAGEGGWLYTPSVTTMPKLRFFFVRNEQALPAASVFFRLYESTILEMPRLNAKSVPKQDRQFNDSHSDALLDDQAQGMHPTTRGGRRGQRSAGRGRGRTKKGGRGRGRGRGQSRGRGSRQPSSVKTAEKAKRQIYITKYLVPVDAAKSGDRSQLKSAIDRQYSDMIAPTGDGSGDTFFHVDNFNVDKAREFVMCATSALDHASAKGLIDDVEKKNMQEKVRMMHHSSQSGLGFDQATYDEYQSAAADRPSKRPRPAPVSYELMPLQGRHASQSHPSRAQSVLPKVVYGVQQPDAVASDLQHMLQYESDISNTAGYNSRVYGKRKGTHFVPVRAQTMLPKLPRHAKTPADKMVQVQAYAPQSSILAQPLNASNLAYERQQVVMRIIQKFIHPSVMAAYRAVCTGQGLGFGRCFVNDLCRAFPQYARCWGRFCPLFHQGGASNNCVFEHAGHAPTDALNIQFFSGPCRVLPDISKRLMQGVVFSDTGEPLVPIELPSPSQR